MKVVRLSASRTGRLYPGKYSWYSFLLETESNPGPQCSRKDYVNEMTQSGIEPATFRLVAPPRVAYYRTVRPEYATISIPKLPLDTILSQVFPPTTCKIYFSDVHCIVCLHCYKYIIWLPYEWHFQQNIAYITEKSIKFKEE